MPPVGNPLFGSSPSNRPASGSAGPSNMGGRFGVSQPTYDFLAGPASPSPPQSSNLRKSVVVSGHNLSGANKIDISNEGLRGELNALKYELETLKSDRELERVRHEAELRALEAKVEEKAKLADEVEADKRFLYEKHKSLSEELAKVKDTFENQKHEQDRLIRQLRAQLAEVQDAADERLEDLRSLERHSKHTQDELETRNKALSGSLETLQREYDENVTALQETQAKCSQQELEIENLKKEAVKVQAATGDLESLQVLKRELSEQITHIKTLETQNKKLVGEVKQLGEAARNVEVLEEQKMALEGKVRMMEQLRGELSEKELQLAILRDEKMKWSAFLEDNEGKLGQGFDGPEALARALMEERVEKAELVERLGRVEPELAERDGAVERAEAERDEVKKELEKVVESYKKLHASRARIERNRQLALKEVTMLREQLKSFSTEESNLMSGNYDTQKTQLISELETLIDTYKRENETLLSDIAKREKETPAPNAQDSSTQPPSPPAPLKRAHDTTAALETEEKLGQLSRRARHYQEELSKVKRSESLAKKELKAALTRLSAVEEAAKARQRILELRDNPTAQHEKVKREELRLLREENDGLLKLLGKAPGNAAKLVPAASLEAAQITLTDLKKSLAEKDKRMARLKQIWTQKSVEWRQAVHSIVGILFDFMPNGRVRVSSRDWSHPADDETPAGVEDPGIIFDGEQGTMKITPEGFSRRISPLVREWVEERGDIPGLIAALMLNRYENGSGRQGDVMED